jgi:hypothetical protein
MAEIKTRPTGASVERFIEAVKNPTRRADARAVCAMMARVTGHEPKMWGPSIIGFGSYHYRYDSGHEGTMCRLGFSPRKGQLVLYLLTGYMEAGGSEGEDALLARLGKHKTGKSCLYINKLADVDMGVLEALCARTWDWMNRRYPD